MLFRCRACGRPVGKGEARGGDWRMCAVCQEGLQKAGVLKTTNTSLVKRQVQQQLRRPSTSRERELLRVRTVLSSSKETTTMYPMEPDYPLNITDLWLTAEPEEPITHPGTDEQETPLTRRVGAMSIMSIWSKSPPQCLAPIIRSGRRSKSHRRSRLTHHMPHNSATGSCCCSC
jgi:hypothetical protein